MKVLLPKGQVNLAWSRPHISRAVDAFVKRCCNLSGGWPPRLNWGQGSLFPFSLIMYLSTLRRCGLLWYWDENGRLIPSWDLHKFQSNEPLWTRSEVAKVHCRGTGCTRGEWRFCFFMSHRGLSPPSYPGHAGVSTSPSRGWQKDQLMFSRRFFIEVFYLSC